MIYNGTPLLFVTFMHAFTFEQFWVGSSLRACVLMTLVNIVIIFEAVSLAIKMG